MTVWSTPSGGDGQRLRHMPVQTPPEASAGARPLVPQPAGPHDRLLLLQERGEGSVLNGRESEQPFSTGLYRSRGRTLVQTQSQHKSQYNSTTP